MDWNTRLCILTYSVVLVQCVVLMTATVVKVKKNDATKMLIVNESLIILWLIFGMHEIQSRNTEELLFAVRLTILPLTLIPSTWLVFSLIYAKLISLKNTGIIALIIVPKLFLYLPALTAKHFHLIVLHKSYDNPSLTQWGLFSAINFQLGYVFIILGIVIILIRSFMDYHILKANVILVVLGPSITLATNFLTSYQIIPDPGFDLTPVSLSVFMLFLYLAIFRYDALEVIRDVTIEMFNEASHGMVIYESNGMILESNKVARHEFFPVLDTSETMFISDLINDLENRSANLTKVHSLADAIMGVDEIYDHHITLDNGSDSKKYYSIDICEAQTGSSKNKVGVIKAFNRTSLSNDILKEERERISGDLHDNLSNMINVVSMNLEFIINNPDKHKEIAECLTTAFNTTNKIRFNLRQILDGLSPVNIADIGLINSLESMFKKIVGAGIHIDFTHLDISDQLNYSYVSGLMIYNICLESINNSLFNGQATEMTIVLSSKNSSAKLLIADNGIGCDEVIPGRGLIGMQNRLEAIGGILVYDSIQGEGFTLSAELPVEGEMEDME